MTFTFELTCNNKRKFLSYMSHHLTKCKHDITNFVITTDNDDGINIVPSYGEFHWKHGEETFIIIHKEEGKPVSGPLHPEYFQRLIIKHNSLESLETFIKDALCFKEPYLDNKILLNYIKGGGYWHNKYIHTLSFKQIYIDHDVKSKLLKTIDAFVSQRDKYLQFGRPYKLNILLTGVPGSGKSSLVKAVALYLQRQLYCLSFSKNLADENLIHLINDVEKESILLLEDIDAFFNERAPIDINVSFSCLINSLDGPLSKEDGLITILTANHPERLDAALLRPGRIDKIIKFDYPKKAHIESAFLDLVDMSKVDLFHAFYEKIRGFKICMSGIVDFLFRHPDDFMEHIDELLNDTRTLEDIVNDKSKKLYS